MKVSHHTIRGHIGSGAISITSQYKSHQPHVSCFYLVDIWKNVAVVHINNRRFVLSLLPRLFVAPSRRWFACFRRKCPGSNQRLRYIRINRFWVKYVKYCFGPEITKSSLIGQENTMRCISGTCFFLTFALAPPCRLAVVSRLIFLSSSKVTSRQLSFRWELGESKLWRTSRPIAFWVITPAVAITTAFQSASQCISG